MIHSTLFADRVRRAFKPTSRGVVGLVDDVLGLCLRFQLQIRFRDGQCEVQRLGADAAETLAIPVPKSVFRAALARIAAICNEQHPEAVTPYRGAGPIAAPAQHMGCAEEVAPPATCYVSYANTPAEQHLEIRFSSSSAHEGNRFTVLLRDRRTVTVPGHALTYIPSASHPTDEGSYGILSRIAGDEVLVAVFRASEVIGVFSGEIDEPGETAS